MRKPAWVFDARSIVNSGGIKSGLNLGELEMGQIIDLFKIIKIVSLFNLFQLR